MTIPEKAIEAAAKVLREVDDTLTYPYPIAEYMNEARAILEAAAPYMQDNEQLPPGGAMSTEIHTDFVTANRTKGGAILRQVKGSALVAEITLTEGQVAFVLDQLGNTNSAQVSIPTEAGIQHDGQ